MIEIFDSRNRCWLVCFPQTGTAERGLSIPNLGDLITASLEASVQRLGGSADRGVSLTPFKGAPGTTGEKWCILFNRLERSFNSTGEIITANHVTTALFDVPARAEPVRQDKAPKTPSATEIKADTALKATLETSCGALLDVCFLQEAHARASETCPSLADKLFEELSIRKGTLTGYIQLECEAPRIDPRVFPRVRWSATWRPFYGSYDEG